MTDKTKILVISLLLPIAMALFGYYTFIYTSNQSFETLQSSTTERIVVSAKAIIDEKILNLAKITEDWSEWTELYENVRENSPAFIANSIGISQMNNLDIDVAAIISDKNEVIFSTSRGVSGAEQKDISSGLAKRILALSMNTKVPNGIFTEEGQLPAIFAFSPILKSDATGPAAGKIFFGKYIDAKFLKNISEMVLYPVTVLSEENLRETGRYEEIISSLKSSGFYLQNKQNEANLAYLSLPTVENTALVLKVNSVSDILAQRSDIYANLFYIFSVLGILSGISVFFLVHGLVLSRIRLLLKELEKPIPDFASIKTAPTDNLGRVVREIKNLLVKAQNSTDTGRYLSAVLSTTSDAVVITGTSGIIQSWNKSAENIFGYSSEFIIDRNIMFMVLPERRDIAEAVIKDRLLKGEGILNYEAILVASGGKKVNVLINASAIKDDLGNPIAIVNVVHSIGENKQSEIGGEIKI